MDREQTDIFMTFFTAGLTIWVILLLTIGFIVHIVRGG